MKKVYVVGLGPGGLNEVTPRAMEALEKSDVIIGYTVYVDLIRSKFEHKKLLTTTMTKEVDRCKMVFEEAMKDQVVSIVCSGDSGVYGMSGLIYEISQGYEAVEIEIISGITAACSGAAVLGAPLIHDFVVISLSDLLTPMELIEKRLECAAIGDFAMSIYNPSSKKRHDYLEKACKIILQHRDPKTPAGWVRNIGRDGQEYKVMTLEELQYEKLDMFTTVFIGNSQSKIINNKIVTPRGYRNV